MERLEHQQPRFGHEQTYSKLLLSVRDNFSLLDLLSRLPQAASAVVNAGIYQTQLVQYGLQRVRNVIEAFLVQHGQTVGYSADVFNIAVWLLCFNSEHRAFAILCALYH
jgi:hypothetical protein